MHNYTTIIISRQITHAVDTAYLNEAHIEFLLLCPYLLGGMLSAYGTKPQDMNYCNLLKLPLTKRISTLKPTISSAHYSTALTSRPLSLQVLLCFSMCFILRFFPTVAHFSYGDK